MSTKIRQTRSLRCLRVKQYPWLVLLACLAMLGLARPASAEDVTGVLRVTSDPAGATVYLGVRPIGETPISYYAPAGVHTVRILRDGSEPYVRRITIRQDQTTEMKAKLYPGKGSVEIVVDPPGAKLKIDGGEEWPTPVRLKDLKPGKYTFTLTAPGHEDETGSFEFEQGKNLLLVTTMMSSAGMVSVTSNPSGALVILDGDDAGLTPLHLEEIEGGEHTVQLILKGHASVFRRFDTSNGDKAEVEVRMPTRGVPLTISTWNKKSRLDIEGMDLGPRATYRFGPVERGRYMVRITAPDKKSIEQSLLVPPTGTALYRAHMRPKTGARPSSLKKNPPFYRHWLFLGSIGAVSAGFTTMAMINFKAAAPTATPTGDVLVTLP